MKQVSRLPDGHCVSPLRAHFRKQLQTAQRHVFSIMSVGLEQRRMLSSKEICTGRSQEIL